MPEGSLTLRVKVLGIEGLRSIPLDLEVSAERPACDKNPSRGVTEKADGGLQTAAREIALPIVPERCVGGPSRVSCKGLVGPRV